MFYFEVEAQIKPFITTNSKKGDHEIQVYDISIYTQPMEIFDPNWLLIPSAKAYLHPMTRDKMVYCFVAVAYADKRAWIERDSFVILTCSLTGKSVTNAWYWNNSPNYN